MFMKSLAFKVTSHPVRKETQTKAKPEPKEPDGVSFLWDHIIKSSLFFLISHRAHAHIPYIPLNYYFLFKQHNQMTWTDRPNL